MEEEIEKLITGKGVSGFMAKYIYIGIYTNLYFLTTKGWFD
jgi:hypothetical protein